MVESISRLVEEDFTGLRAAPGAAQQTATMRGWLEHRSHIPGLAGPVRWSWAVAGIADCLASGPHTEAHARSLLLLAGADQAAIDSGSWLLGSEFLLEGAAPLQSFHSPSWSRSSRTTAHADPGSQVDSCGHVACPREGGFCRSAAKVGRRVWAASSWLRCHLQRSDREGGEARERSTPKGAKKRRKVSETWRLEPSCSACVAEACLGSLFSPAFSRALQPLGPKASREFSSFGCLGLGGAEPGL